MLRPICPASRLQIILGKGSAGGQNRRDISFYVQTIAIGDNLYGPCPHPTQGAYSGTDFQNDALAEPAKRRSEDSSIRA